MFISLTYQNVKLNKNRKSNRTSITGKICISEMVLMIDRFIKGLEALNISPNELKIILDLLKKLNDEPRIELIDRLMRFN